MVFTFAKICTLRIGNILVADIKTSVLFIEFSKSLIDKLHAWHSKDIPIDNIAKSTHSLHFYDSMLVIEKKKNEQTI